MGHGERGLESDAFLAGESEHGGVIEEILECNDGGEDGTEVFGAGEPGGTETANGVEVEGEAALAELETGELAAGEGTNKLLVDIAEG